MVLALQGLKIFAIFGAQRMLPSLVTVAVLRELSPVLATVLVAAQGGSSCAAELGAMAIKEELDATAVMAVDPLTMHVVPRFLAIVIACPLMNMAGSVAGIYGSYVTAVYMKGEQSGVFLSELWVNLTPVDVWAGSFKTAVFGAVVGMTACYMGTHATGGAAGVGRAVNDTVVYGVTAFIIVNYVLTSALFGAVGG
jgi:phospholipid/cholesterol/gamma-HCH transport system permease protein